MCNNFVHSALLMHLLFVYVKEFLNVFQNVQTGSALALSEMEVIGLHRCAIEPKLL